MNPRFAGSNPAEDDGFLREIKILSMTSFGGQVKTSALCREILRHVKTPAEYEKDALSAKFMAISRQVYTASLPGVSAGYCQRALVDELRMIKTQDGNA
jgi:hypothetical protein